MGKLKYLYCFMAVILIMAILLTGCGSSQAAATPSAPTLSSSSSPSITQTISPATNVSPTATKFTTYTDVNGVFSISYPQDWKIEPQGDLVQSSKDLANKIAQNLPVDDLIDLFYAGVRKPDKSFSPSIDFLVVPPPTINDQVLLVNTYMSRYEKLYGDYQAISRTNGLTVHGREATLFEFIVSISGTKYYHMEELFYMKGIATWHITCTAEADTYDRWKNDFKTIIQSLKILK